MEITSFELHEQQPPFLDFPFRISIRGTGLAPRAVPFDAKFAAELIWALRPALDGGGVIGYLAALPALDEELLAGDADVRRKDTVVSVNR